MQTRKSDALQARSGAFIDAWARILIGLGSVLDELERQSEEIEAMLAEPGKRQRFQGAIAGTNWARWYARSAAALVGAAVCVIVPLSAVQEAMDKVGLGRALGRLGLGNLSTAAGDREFVVLPKLGVSAWKMIDAQCRAIVAFQRTMNALIQQGVSGDDQGFIDAIRIDPGAIATPPVVQRVHAAVAAGDHEFIKRLSSALRNPLARDALSNSRLHCALWLMNQTRALTKLNKDTAYELFAIRTRLYAVHGREDSAGSLWRLIQRWKIEVATKAGG